MKARFYRFLGALARSDEPLTQAQIVAASGLSQATVSRCAQEGIRQGLLAATGLDSCTPGRPASAYQLIRENVYVAGCIVRPGRFEIGLYDLDLDPVRLNGHTLRPAGFPMTAWSDADIIEAITGPLEDWRRFGPVRERLGLISVIDYHHGVPPESLAGLERALSGHFGLACAVTDPPGQAAAHAVYHWPALAGRVLFCVWLEGDLMWCQYYEAGWPAGRLKVARPPEDFLRVPDRGAPTPEHPVHGFADTPGWVKEDGPLAPSAARQLDQQAERLAKRLFPHSLARFHEEIPLAGVIAGTWRRDVLERAAQSLSRLHAHNYPHKPGFACIGLHVAGEGAAVAADLAATRLTLA